MWNTSIMPSAFTRSMAVLRAQNAPVRPMPALCVCVYVICTCGWGQRERDERSISWDPHPYNVSTCIIIEPIILHPAKLEIHYHLQWTAMALSLVFSCARRT